MQIYFVTKKQFIVFGLDFISKRDLDLCETDFAYLNGEEEGDTKTTCMCVCVRVCGKLEKLNVVVK